MTEQEYISYCERELTRLEARRSVHGGNMGRP